MGVLGKLDSDSKAKGEGGLRAAGTNGGPKPPSAQGAGPGGGAAGGGNGPQGPGNLAGGAAIVLPANAFPNGIPANALVVLPIPGPTKELSDQLEKGPVALTFDQMWKMLGFNGPAVQVQDEQGHPVMLGLEDLLSQLQNQWDAAPEDLNRARMLAQALTQYERFEKAETVWARIIAKGGGGTGEDWLTLGVAQLRQKKFDKAESTLKGAQNLMPDNPYPSLHLAKLAKDKEDAKGERDMVERAISISVGCVDAWTYFFRIVREADGEEKAMQTIEEMANAPVNQKAVAPFIAVQSFYADDDKTRDTAIVWAKKAVARNAQDPLAVFCLAALHARANDMQSAITLLQPYEAKMATDLRLASIYFDVLFQSRQIDKVTKLLNALAGSSNPEVKRFALERSQMVGQYLQQQQAQLGAMQRNNKA
jgi:tetratricopeptide (TPR) repeat protein